MVYGRSSSSGGGRYDTYGSSSGGGGYARRDSGGPRRSAGNTFGAIDLPDQRPSMNRAAMGGRPSVSPWASGESPSRHSWGGPPAQSGRGGMGTDPFGPLGAVSGGAQSNETLSMAANLVASILQQNQQQQQRRPEPFASSRIQPLYSGGGDGYGHSAYRGARPGGVGFQGRSDYSPRTEYANKYDSRRDSFPPSRGRTNLRGARGATRSRGAFTSRTPARRVDNKQDNKPSSANKKKPEQTKKPVKTTQQALDEAKAAALEKQMEKEGAQKPSEDAEGQELLAKSDETPADTKDAAETKEADEKKAETGEAAEKKEGDAAEATPADDAEKEKKSPTKPQREKIDSKYLNCSVCNVSNISTEQGFSEHVRGRRHQTMMQMMEQRLEQTAKLIRIEVQVASKRAEIERQRRGKANAKDYGYCGMCNIRVFEDLNEHRSNDPLHAKLKKFLHPRCCGLRFDTPVMYERHLLSFSHLRKQMSRDKEQEEAGEGAVAVNPCPPTDTKVNGEAAAGDEAAKEGESGDKPEGEATATEGESAVKQEGEAMETDATKPEKPEKPEEPEEEEEPAPVMYDPEVAVATKSGQPFTGTFCTICRLAMPDSSWTEHCKSRVHYNRHMVVVQRAEMARREAAAEAARKAAKAAKAEAAAAAAAAVNAEAEEVEVVEGEAEEEASPAEEQTEGAEPARGTKRPAEDEDVGGDAKIAATEPEVVDLDGEADAEEPAADAAADDEVVEEVPAEDAPATAAAAAEPAPAPATAPAAAAPADSKPAAAAAAPAAAAPKPAAAAAAPAAAAPKPAAAPAAAAPKPAAAPAPATPKPAPATPKPAPATPKPVSTPNRGRGGRGGHRGSPRGGFARRSRGSGRGGRR